MIGDRIRELRIKNGYTQTELAKRLQLTRSSINAWEMGISVPSTQYVIELAALFKTSTDYILERTSDEIIDISELTIEEKEIIIHLLNYFSTARKAMDFVKNKKSGDEEGDEFESGPMVFRVKNTTRRRRRPEDGGNDNKVTE